MKGLGLFKPSEKKTTSIELQPVSGERVDPFLFPGLPDEVLLLILINLDIKALALASLVSKDWYRLSRDATLWSSMHFSHHIDKFIIRMVIREFNISEKVLPYYYPTFSYMLKMRKDYQHFENALAITQTIISRDKNPEKEKYWTPKQKLDLLCKILTIYKHSMLMTDILKNLRRTFQDKARQSIVTTCINDYKKIIPDFNRKIEKIHLLRFMRTPPDWVIKLSRLLENPNNVLRSLELIDIDLTGELITALKNKHCQLTFLRIAGGTHKNNENFLADVITNSLTDLHILGIKMSNEETITFAQAIQKTDQNLAFLEFVGNIIDDDGAKALAEAIKNENSKLISLKFTMNSAITHAGKKSLAEAVVYRKNQFDKEIEISGFLNNNLADFLKTAKEAVIDTPELTKGQVNQRGFGHSL